MSSLYTAEELKKRMESNDNRSTAKPYLLLLRRHVPQVVDGNYGGSKEYVENITGDYWSRPTRAELETVLRVDYFENDPTWEPKHGDITEIYTDIKYETVNVFLTDQGYQDHLKINKHNLGTHDTYGIHAFRNKEMLSLMSLVDEVIELKEKLKSAEEVIEDSFAIVRDSYDKDYANDRMFAKLKECAEMLRAQVVKQRKEV